MKKSIVPFCLLITAIYIIIKEINKRSLIANKRRFRLLSIRRYMRYIKLIINKKVICTIMIASIISNSIVMIKENQNSKLQEGNIDVRAIVISDKEEKGEKYQYKAKSENQIYYMVINKKSKEKLEYGDLVDVRGKFVKPERQRNEGGFDYSLYLKSISVVGTIQANKVNVMSHGQMNKIDEKFYQINKKIKENVCSMADERTAGILIGILLGDTSYIEEETKENFRDSNISHILAVSGMHITYLILGLNLFLKKKNRKEKNKSNNYTWLNILYENNRIYSINRKSRNYGNITNASIFTLSKKRYMECNCIITTYYSNRKSL